MSIGEIRKALITETKNKQKNELNLARDHKSSLFYNIDVSNNKEEAKKFDDSLNGISIYTTKIKNLANSYNYSNTCSSLSRVQTNTSHSFYEKIKSELERASLESYTELRTQFDSNCKKINSNITIVSEKIKKYDKLEKDIKNLEDDIDALEAKNPPGDTSGLKAKKALYKNQQDNICSSAQSCLTLIKMFNEQNEKLLNRGIKKA